MLYTMKNYILIAIFSAFLFFSICFSQSNLLKITNGSGVSGSTGNIVTFELENSTEVAGLQLTLNYDTEFLKMTEIIASSRSNQMSIFSYNEPNPGELRLIISDFSGKVIEAGDGLIGNISFDVKENASINDVDLTLSNVVLSNTEAQSIPVLIENGMFSIVSQTTINNQKNQIPKSYILEQNYPNPFNPSTKIKFALPEQQLVQIEVFDTSGKSLYTLLNKTMPAGYHTIEFIAENLSSGIYLYRIQAGNFQDVKKMILIK